MVLQEERSLSSDLYHVYIACLCITRCSSTLFCSVLADGSTAVHCACHSGNHEALQVLINYSANLSVEDSQGRLPIHWACAHPSRQCLKVCLGGKVMENGPKKLWK